MTSRTARRLSVVIPNYNHGRLISRAIEAVVSQSRPPDELIVVDDKSTDDSAARIAALAARYPIITFIKNIENMGVNSSIRMALGMTTGHYVYCGAADDYVLPGFFEEAMAMAERHAGAGSIAGECVVMDSSGNEMRLQTVSHWETSRFVNPATFLNDYLYVVGAMHSLASAVLYRREALQAVGLFREELGPWSDTFAFRAIGLRHGICFLKRRCAAWTVSPDGFSQTTVKDPQMAMTMIRRAAQLMRSPEFLDVFPAEYVEDWADKYCQEVVTNSVSKWVGEPSPEYWRALRDRPLHNRLLNGLLWRFHGQYRAFLAFYLTRSLTRLASGRPPAPGAD